MATEFMTRDEQLHWVDVAKKMTGMREAESNEKGIYQNIALQLSYIAECIANRESTRDKLADVNIGQLSVQFFDGVDDAYSSQLKRVYFIVDHLRRGLKVPKIDETGNVIN